MSPRVPELRLLCKCRQPVLNALRVAGHHIEVSAVDVTELPHAIQKVVGKSPDILDADPDSQPISVRSLAESSAHSRNGQRPLRHLAHPAIPVVQCRLLSGPHSDRDLYDNKNPRTGVKPGSRGPWRESLNPSVSAPTN